MVAPPPHDAMDFRLHNSKVKTKMHPILIPFLEKKENKKESKSESAGVSLGSD